VYGTPAEALKMQEWLDSAPNKVKQAFDELAKRNQELATDLVKQFQEQIKKAP
jgi:hypothetical protein